MLKRILLIFLLPVVLTACRGDEHELDLFHLTLGTEVDAEVAMGSHSAEITINGYARWIEVGIIGDFDDYSLSDDIPDWLTITESTMNNRPNHFRIQVAALDNDTRIGKVRFTVFKGKQSQPGSITIIQKPCTIEDLKRTESRAIKKYLSKFDVVDTFPGLGDIQVGSVAPFYKLNKEGSVYMQIVKMGTQSAATKGETIYFRYLRYDLLSYLENGFLPIGQGNGNSSTQDVTSFELDSDKLSTLQWGPAIQMPMLLGLPVDSEVNLVVTSEAGITAEISSTIPYLYNIRYFRNAY